MLSITLGVIFETRLLLRSKIEITADSGFELVSSILSNSKNLLSEERENRVALDTSPLSTISSSESFCTKVSSTRISYKNLRL